MNLAGYTAAKPNCKASRFCQRGTDVQSKPGRVRAWTPAHVPSRTQTRPDPRPHPTFHTKTAEGKDNVNTLFLRAFLVAREEIS